MNYDFMLAIESIERERGIKKEMLFSAIEAALISAYKRNFNSAANVRVDIDQETGNIKVYSCQEVVEEVTSPQQQIHIDEAKQKNPRLEVGDILEEEVTPKNFGRIAAQTAKQVVIQRIREAERELVYEEFIDREEDIVTGVVQRFEQRNVVINLGKAEAILTPQEQMPGDHYRQGERLKTYIMEVKRTTKGPQIYVTRTHPGLLKRLFELEVPEIYNGVIEIKSVAREPGYRSKLSIASRKSEVDPVGACVGPKGSRVQAVVNELKGEKIDIVEWSEDPEEYVSNSLSPAKVLSVHINEDRKSALVVVPDYQLSLAIGREGQNARLAAKLTGWKIDIMSESRYQEVFSAEKEESPEAEELTEGDAGSRDEEGAGADRIETLEEEGAGRELSGMDLTERETVPEKLSGGMEEDEENASPGEEDAPAEPPSE